MNRRLPLLVFVIGLILFVASGIVHFAMNDLGLLSDALVYPGNTLLVLSGLLFIRQKHNEGGYLTAQPQLTVAFLTGWWLVFFVSGFLVEVQVGGTLALELYEADFFMVLFVPLIYLFQRLERRWRAHRAPVTPLPSETSVRVPVARRPFAPWERARLFLIILAALLAASAIGASIPMDAGTARTTYDAAVRQIGTPSAYSIWKNNFLIATVGFVPGYGVTFELTTSFNTGQVFDAVGVLSQRAPGDVLYLQTVLAPFFWLEFLCYSIAPTASLLTLQAHRRGVFRREFVITILTFVGVAAVLYVSAIIEMAYISVG